MYFKKTYKKKRETENKERKEGWEIKFLKKKRKKEKVVKRKEDHK